MLYEYVCDDCELKFDIDHSMDCVESQYCPKCNKLLRKVFGTAPAIYRCYGFYKTDYRR